MTVEMLIERLNDVKDKKINVYFSSGWGERQEIDGAFEIVELGKMAEVPYVLLTED